MMALPATPFELQTALRFHKALHLGKISVLLSLLSTMLTGYLYIHSIEEDTEKQGK